MKMRSRSALGAAALAFAAGTAIAHPLRLDYCVDALPGGQYQYTFTLTLDNNDNTWAPGQGWTWITFGATQAMSSPLEDFVMDPSSYPIGPFTELTGSGGYLNGPTLGPLTDPNSNFIYWIPSAVGESLTWTGTSANFIPEAQMAFSTLITTGGAGQAAFSPAVRIVCTGAQGACCLADGTCVQLSGAGCVNAGGVYSGDNVPCSSVSCPQPATGACCRDDGCVITTQAICTATTGTYQGDNTPCATANCSPATAFREGADVGDVPGTAAVVSGFTLRRHIGPLDEGILMQAAARILAGPGHEAEVAPAGRVWGLAQTGRFDEARAGLGEAAKAARRLPVKAFPAVLPAALARRPEAGPLEKRLRLTWAASRGRL